jgi:ABC-type lipoprotein export system ATPase subunit
MRLLSDLGLQERVRAFPATLSGGQQQRAAVARALINQPRLLLADEPTGALDSESGEQVMSLLQQLHAIGQTILLVTHDAKLATRFASRVITLNDGQVVDDTVLVTTVLPASKLVRVRGAELVRAGTEDQG